MSKRTGPTNEELRKLVSTLKKEKSPLWLRLANELSRPTRKRREVNISRINRFSSPNDTVVVPGKVLGAGALTHSLTVAAFAFSAGARKRIEEVKGRCISILELIKENPKGAGIKLLC
ncbi:MAG: 50S ribosomal protein L18e [Candidatus Woesearchaeota archaeon]